MADASLGQVVDERRVMELPVWRQRRVVGTMAPGVVNGTTLRQSDRGSNNVNSQFATNGSGMYNNEFSLDGVSNTIADTQGTAVRSGCIHSTDECRGRVQDADGLL